MQDDTILTVEQEIHTNSTDEARKFEGVFIPATIWLSKEFTWIEKIILTEIKSLSKKHSYCFASNDYLSKFTGASIRAVSQTISMFRELGLIDVIFDGRKRYIKLNENYEQIVDNYKRPEKASTKCKSDVQTTAIKDNDIDEASIKCKSDVQNMQPYNNYNINIDIISTIKSDKSNLMLDTGSDEPSDVSYKQNEFNHNENSMGMSCYEEENKQTKTAHAGEDASDVFAGDSSMPETVDTTKEQSELDKLNAIKQFKGTPKPAKPKSTTSPFKKCLKMIYDANYSDEVKSALVEFLKSLSQYRHITESAFELILNNLEKSIEECPYPNDEGLMNFLRLRVVKGSHAKGYRDFYKIKPYELTQWVSEFRGTSISVERKFNDDAKSVVYDPNNPDHQLATNPDGTPMIF